VAPSAIARSRLVVRSRVLKFAARGRVAGGAAAVLPRSVAAVAQGRAPTGLSEFSHELLPEGPILARMLVSRPTATLTHLTGQSILPKL
jgi:hypothetical protein